MFNKLWILACLPLLVAFKGVPPENEVFEPATERRKPAVAVWEYSIDPSANDRDTVVIFNRRDGLIFDKSPGAGEMHLSVANAVKTSLTKSDRFTILDSTALESVGHTFRERIPEPLPNPAAAVEAGRRLKLDYVLYGNVESAATSLNREENEYEHKGRKERTTSWKGRIELTVHHVAVDVRTGEVWKETRDTQTREETWSYRPGNSQWRKMFSKAADRTGGNWVRQLVPEREGRVITRGNGVLVINLGKQDGVGMDTDFSFVRSEPLRDAAGVAIRDEDGEFLIRPVPVQASPSSSHKPGPVYGRPMEIQDEFCTVKVGYRGSGGFLGLDTKLRENANCLAAVQVGDKAVLFQRVGK